MSRGCGNGVTCGSLLHGLHLQQRFNKLSQFRAVNSMINFGRIKDDKRCNLLSCKMFIGLPGKNYHGNIENKGGSKPVGTRWNHISSNHQFFSPVKKSDKTEKPILIDGNLTALCAWCCPKLSKLFSLFSEEILVRTSWRRKHVRGSPIPASLIVNLYLNEWKLEHAANNDVGILLHGRTTHGSIIIPKPKKE